MLPSRLRRTDMVHKNDESVEPDPVNGNVAGLGSVGNLRVS